MEAIYQFNFLNNGINKSIHILCQYLLKPQYSNKNSMKKKKKLTNNDHHFFAYAIS